MKKVIKIIIPVLVVAVFFFMGFKIYLVSNKVDNYPR